MASATSAPNTAADPATQSQPQSAGKRTRVTRKRMVYGFVWSYEELIQWGVRRYGPPDSGRGTEEDYVTEAIFFLQTKPCLIWRGIAAQPVVSATVRHGSDFSIALADNKSKDTMTRPSREVIDRLKEILEVTEDPEWRQVRGSY